MKTGHSVILVATPASMLVAGWAAGIEFLSPPGDSDGTSRQISGYALPLLFKAVSQKQEANVGFMSGPSYTTQGFDSPVQSAMQAAGLA